jgi:hypothetical protein
MPLRTAAKLKRKFKKDFVVAYAGAESAKRTLRQRSRKRRRFLAKSFERETGLSSHWLEEFHDQITEHFL